MQSVCTYVASLSLTQADGITLFTLDRALLFTVAVCGIRQMLYTQVANATPDFHWFKTAMPLRLIELLTN